MLLFEIRCVFSCTCADVISTFSTLTYAGTWVRVEGQNFRQFAVASMISGFSIAAVVRNAWVKSDCRDRSLVRACDEQLESADVDLRLVILRQTLTTLVLAGR